MFASARNALRSAPLILALLLIAGCATKPPPSPPLPSVAPAPPAPPAPPPAAAPDRVTGLSESALTAAFGQPALTRKDGIAEVWRYDGTRKDGVTCHAFFFLYDNQGVRVVRHFETLPEGARGDQSCLDALRVKP